MLADRIAHIFMSNRVIKNKEKTLAEMKKAVVESARKFTLIHL